MSKLTWFTNDNVVDAIPAARVASKPLLVDFWDPHCLGCAKLFISTYADPMVHELLAREFICVKYNIKQPDEWFRKLTGSVAHLWTPDIIVLTDRPRQLRRSCGYLPPTRFAAQLRLGLGMWNLYRGDAEQALKHFGLVATLDDAGDAAPEALYMTGIASYRDGGLAALRKAWGALAERYPDSDWGRRADSLDVVIPDAGFMPDDISTIHLLSPIGVAR
ncbi:MAG: hypothetical protein ABIY52_09405 [Gemmatimonadaceae bacterium]